MFVCLVCFVPTVFSLLTFLFSIQVGKSGPPTMVKLEGITNSLSHKDINTAVEKFGKTKSFVLFRSKQQVLTR